MYPTLNFDWILASISTILTLDCIEYLERTHGRKCDVTDLRCGFCRCTAGDIETNLHIENTGLQQERNERNNPMERRRKTVLQETIRKKEQL